MYKTAYPRVTVYRRFFAFVTQYKIKISNLTHHFDVEVIYVVP